MKARVSFILSLIVFGLCMGVAGCGGSASQPVSSQAAPSPPPPPTQPGRVIGPSSVAVAPDPTGKFGKFAYVTNAEMNNISMYAINATTGALTLTGTVVAGTFPMSIAVDPSGKFAYVVGDGCALDTFDGEVSMHSINLLTGALSTIGSPVPAGVCPSAVIVDPLGRFAYVTDDSGLNGHQDDNVAMYAINGATGALTSIRFAGTGSGPSFVAVDPAGKFAYVTNFLSNDVSVYSIDAITGALTLIETIGT